jgi:putative transposase
MAAGIWVFFYTSALNGIWALDFMADRLYDGRPFRVLNVLDEANREALAIEPARSLPSLRVVAVLEQLVELHGAPAGLRCDYGPELLAETLTSWCWAQGIALHSIQPGKPDQNAFIERFNRTDREEVLDAWLLGSIEDVRAISEPWRHRYNTVRPHDSLGGVPPLTYLPRSTAA